MPARYCRRSIVVSSRSGRAFPVIFGLLKTFMGSYVTVFLDGAYKYDSIPTWDFQGRYLSNQMKIL
jgi:hypothetical protein